MRHGVLDSWLFLRFGFIGLVGGGVLDFVEIGVGFLDLVEIGFGVLDFSITRFMGLVGGGGCLCGFLGLFGGDSGLRWWLMVLERDGERDRVSEEDERGEREEVERMRERLG